MLERGEVANSWRRERWDSLRLLTPNWQARLPGYRYEGPDPDGYMTSAEVIAFITQGLSNQEIADKLGVSFFTARNHVERLLVKLGLGGRARVAALLNGRA